MLINITQAKLDTHQKTLITAALSHNATTSIVFSGDGAYAHVVEQAFLAECVSKSNAESVLHVHVIKEDATARGVTLSQTVNPLDYQGFAALTSTFNQMVTF